MDTGSQQKRGPNLGQDSVTTLLAANSDCATASYSQGSTLRKHVVEIDAEDGMGIVFAFNLITTQSGS